MMSEQYVKQFEKELSNILEFWSTDMLDHEFGGFYGQITGLGVTQPESHKGIILNSRILWTFSAATNYRSVKSYRDIAERAYNYIIDHFIDQKFGGVFWMLDYQGNPINRKKQIYAQAFSIYALAEYHKIEPSSKALESAISIFKLLEKYSFDQKLNGYYEAFSEDWDAIKDVRLSDKDLNAQKTMNTHLHILEAYTNLYSVWKEESLRLQLINLIQLLSDKFLFQSGHFKLFFTEKWDLLTTDVSYGHDIEGSWLIMEAAKVTGDDKLISETQKVGLLMAKAATRGLDSDGALMNEGEEGGEITDTDKHWWPQAEALVGYLNAYQLTSESQYLEMTERIWNFIKNNIVDPNGEWYWRLDRSGKPILTEDKAGPWKCPYHNGRAMLEIIKRLSE